MFWELSKLCINDQTGGRLAQYPRRLLKNPRNVSETSYIEERGVRRRRCRQCIAEEDLTKLFGVTRFVSTRKNAIGISGRLRILDDALTPSPPNPRTTENPIAFY